MELLPCPFCGGEPQQGMFSVWCSKCGVCTAEDTLLTKEEVSSLWNKRVSTKELVILPEDETPIQLDIRLKRIEELLESKLSENSMDLKLWGDLNFVRHCRNRLAEIFKSVH
jgi:hypothetical protein